MLRSGNYQIQTQLLSQQQQQSLKILQMSIVELTEFVNEEYLSNPLCEIGNPNPPHDDFESLASYFSEHDVFIRQGAYETDETFKPELSTPSFETSWKFSLKEQIYDGNKTPSMLEEKMIDLLDEHGFLAYTDYELARMLHCGEQQCMEARKRLKKLDPAGIGCENIGSFMEFQLEQAKVTITPQIHNLLSKYFWELGEYGYGLIAKKVGMETGEVRKLAQRISKMRPYPFTSPEQKGIYIIPDLYVEWRDGTYIVRANEDKSRLPGVSRYYTSYLNAAHTEAEKAYIRDKVQRVRWLSMAVEQRKKTILQIGEQILKKQAEFFNDGALKAVSQKSIADELGINESTVSRAIAGKYLACHRGVFPLKKFFTTGSVCAVREDSNDRSGTKISRETIKEELCRIITEEDKKRPYSDDMLCKMFEKEGVKISRRTIAKYRSECGIRGTADRREKG